MHFSIPHKKLMVGFKNLTFIGIINGSIEKPLSMIQVSNVTVTRISAMRALF